MIFNLALVYSLVKFIRIAGPLEHRHCQVCQDDESGFLYPKNSFRVKLKLLSTFVFFDNFDFLPSPRPSPTSSRRPIS